MKKFIKIICSVMTVVLVVVSLNGTYVMGYYSIGKGDTKGIDPSNNQFKSAKSKVYDIKSVYISGNIKEKYGLEIFHYEAPESGFYIVYTTGSLDTVGKVYEEQNFLWTADYDEVASNDDGNYLNYGNNCAMVVEMDKGEDYYICIRAYNTKTGSYGLNIAPNEDKIYSSNGGIWKMEIVGSKELYKANYLCEKQYLTKEQVILLYGTLDPAQNATLKDSGYNIDILRQKYKSNDFEDAIEYANSMLDILLGDYPLVSISASIIGSIVLNQYRANEVDDLDLMTMLVEKCGVRRNPETQKLTAKNGIVAERWYKLIDTTMYNYKYYGSNATTLTGREYYSGYWKEN